MNNKYQVYVMLGLLAGIIFFSLMYPFMKIGSNSAAMKLEDLQTEFNSLKNSTMADAAKEKKLTELQLKMSNQKLKVEAEKDREANNDLDLTQIIVLSALCLSLIWVIFHKVEIIAYFFTVILFSISVYAYLKLKLNVDLLDNFAFNKYCFFCSFCLCFCDFYKITSQEKYE
jgi:Flp pilus assembly protein TadB